jgi:hypothetical protein
MGPQRVECCSHGPQGHHSLKVWEGPFPTSRQGVLWSHTTRRHSRLVSSRAGQSFPVVLPRVVWFRPEPHEPLDAVQHDLARRRVEPHDWPQFQWYGAESCDSGQNSRAVWFTRMAPRRVEPHKPLGALPHHSARTGPHGSEPFPVLEGHAIVSPRGAQCPHWQIVAMVSSLLNESSPWRVHSS